MANYFVSAAGNNSNSGTSSGSPWQTVAKVNSVTFSPGDTISFRGGDTFSGTTLVAGQSGTSGNPITYTSYGTGRATISVNNWRAFEAIDRGGIKLNNINFTGVAKATNGQDGILFSNTGSTNLAPITLIDVDVTQAGQTGVMFKGYPLGAGYTSVSLTRVTSHHNLWDGATLWSGTALTTLGAFGSLYVGYCSFHNNDGVATPKGGNGMWFNGVGSGTVEYSLFHDNGANADGCYGFWCYDSSNVIVQSCESYNNHTGGTKDGGGFDFDGGMQNSTMQYCYSHGNEGAGYALIAAGPNPQEWQNNTIRFCISENDGRETFPNSGIMLYGDPTHQYNTDGRALLNFNIYQCTVYMSAPPVGTGRCLYSFDHVVTAAGRIRNCAFEATGSAEIVNIEVGQTDLLFQGNDYWSTGTFKVTWAGTTYGSLAAWRTATNQEKNGAADTGLSVDPQFVNAGGGGTIGNATQLATLTAYKLSATSPLIDAGLNLSTLFSLNPGLLDFYGTLFPQGSGYAIGAAEVLPAILGIQVFASDFLRVRITATSAFLVLPLPPPPPPPPPILPPLVSRVGQYHMGVCLVTRGSNAVTISGGSTGATTVAAGHLFKTDRDGDAVYKIATRTPASGPVLTGLTLTAQYGGANSAGVGYQICRDYSANRHYPLIAPGDLDAADWLSKSLTMVDTDVAHLTAWTSST
jgi:hypothetical protein